MKTIVVSGGTKGIGKAIVTKFLHEGFLVITCARSQEGLTQLIEESKQASGTLLTYQADLSERNSVNEFVQFIRKQTTTLEVLVNNTGVFLPGKISEEADGVFERTMTTNLNSAYYLTRGLLDMFIQQKAGSIFNICSTASIMPYLNGGSYCVSKFALLGMTKVLREEMKEHQVKVTAVLPGATKTASWEGVDLPDERFIQAEDIAESIWSVYTLSDRTVVEEILIRPQLGDL